MGGKPWWKRNKEVKELERREKIRKEFPNAEGPVAPPIQDLRTSSSTPLPEHLQRWLVENSDKIDLGNPILANKPAPPGAEFDHNSGNLQFIRYVDHSGMERN